MRWSTVRVLVLALFTWGTAVQAGQTLYVTKQGDDTLCNGSADAGVASAPNCAYKTLQRASNHSSLAAGDTILVGQGTYQECTEGHNYNGGGVSGTTYSILIVRDSGSSANPIVVRGKGDGPVILDSTSTGRCSATTSTVCDEDADCPGTEVCQNICGNAIWIDTGAEYVVIGGDGPNEGFTIRGKWPVVYQVDAYQKGRLYSNAKGTQAIANTFEKNDHPSGMGRTCSSTTSRTCAADADCPSGQTCSAGTACTSCAAMRFDVQQELKALRNSCTVTNENRCISAAGDKCYGSGCPTQTELTGNRLYSAGNPHGTWRDHALVKLMGTDGALVDGNYFQVGDATHFLNTGSAMCMYVRDQRNGLYTNNICEYYGDDGSGAGIYVQDSSNDTGGGACLSGGGTGTCPVSCVGTDCPITENHKFYNNTFYGATSGGTTTTIHSIDCEGCVWKNNLFVAKNSNDIEEAFDCPDDGGNTFGSNWQYQYKNGTCGGFSGTTTPALDGQANPSDSKPVPFFQLTSSSTSLMSAGTVESGVPTIDFDAQSRGGSVDIGADEYMSGDLLSETFDLNLSSGYDNTGWVVTGSSSGITLTPDATNNPPIGSTGFNTEALNVSVTTSAKNKRTEKDVSSAAAACGEVRLYVSSAGIASSETTSIFGLLKSGGNLANNAQPAILQLHRDGAGQLTLLLKVNGTQVDSKSISTGTNYGIRITVNDTTDSWSWQTAVGSGAFSSEGAGTANPAAAVAKVGLGSASGVTATTTLFFDSVNVFSNSCP